MEIFDAVENFLTGPQIRSYWSRIDIDFILDNNTLAL